MSRKELLLIQFDAVISVIENTRKNPIFSGYRPMIRFDNSKHGYDGQMTFHNEPIKLGTSNVNITLKMIYHRKLKAFYKPKQAFTFHEGPKKIGQGTITHVYSDLR